MSNAELRCAEGDGILGRVKPRGTRVLPGGERTLLEVADLVEQECGQRDIGAMVAYCELLEKMELIGIQFS